MEVGYPEKRVELRILKKRCSRLDDEILEKLVHLAQELRHTSCPEQGRASLSAPFSTRSLVRVASLLNVCASLSVPKALETAFAARLPKEEREYVMRICQAPAALLEPDELCEAKKAKSGAKKGKDEEGSCTAA